MFPFVLQNFFACYSIYQQYYDHKPPFLHQFDKNEFRKAASLNRLVSLLGPQDLHFKRYFMKRLSLMLSDKNGGFISNARQSVQSRWWYGTLEKLPRLRDTAHTSLERPVSLERLESFLRDFCVVPFCHPQSWGFLLDKVSSLGAGHPIWLEVI